MIGEAIKKLVGGEDLERNAMFDVFGYVMDGKANTAWSGLGSRIDAQRNPLKLVGGSRLTKSVLSKAIAKGIDGTHLGETDHDLGSYRLRLFHLLLPVTAK